MKQNYKKYFSSSRRNVTNLSFYFFLLSSKLEKFSKKTFKKIGCRKRETNGEEGQREAEVKGGEKKRIRRSPSVLKPANVTSNIPCISFNVITMADWMTYCE